ncbi:DUF305 domain-containing protein [Nonomuraea muscovyensis]|uniref:Uncharacterized protein (DUF305 family) n=1 Tax=Nonomuraea muscovyensis TaxID=1124761 RepID=A0A7X0BWK5_9ACTN|nr:DUF305 domain-containing protein [Nonomuraea muscovyensis]MBB6344262.1 uncharacterized protein (DUF305 family) [Nonomuraea muscovyensis]MDF2710586.1 hypothetical protein [Nonomuraea muscovyensis]
MEKPRNLAKPFAAAAVVVVVAAALFLVFGRGGAPGDASPEAGFARDMATHHAQAVEMSFVIRDKSETREIRSLAFDIINTQANQRGMFLGWLQQWGLSPVGEQRPMAWMAGHGHGGAPVQPGVMPGMATPAELTRLKELRGTEAEVLFLQLMIRHHEGGVQMAEGLLKLSDREEVAGMARKIVTGQAGEIKLMTDMLRHRAAQPLPSLLK